MTRQSAALPPPRNTRNGLKWRDGRPRWEPSPVNRACGLTRGVDLKDMHGRWMDRGDAIAVADARTQWATIVRKARLETAEGSDARRHLRSALDRLPPEPADPAARHRRYLLADLIEAARATLDQREPDAELALGVAPRSVQAMINACFDDPRWVRARSPSTVAVYRIQARKLAARFGTRRVNSITRGELREWYIDLVETISPATANLAIGAVGAIFKWATLQNPPWLDSNPCTQLSQVSAPGRRVFWTPEQELAFIPWCDANGFADVADAAVTCLWTGARQVDAAKIDMPDIEGRDTWRFVPQKTQRKAIEALPGLMPQVRARIARRRAELDADPVRHLNAEPFLWNPVTSKRHTSDSIRERFEAARGDAVAAGVVDADFATKHFQDTRDTCVTRLWAAGVSLERIASWGGWSLKTVGDIIRKHYLTLLDEGARETCDQLQVWAQRNGLALDAA